MAGGLDQPAWRELRARVQDALAAWRAAPPRTTLTGIAAVGEVTRRLGAQYLRDLVAASPRADLAALPPQERLRCPERGGRLAPRGQHGREALTLGPPDPLRRRRSYAVCPACGPIRSSPPHPRRHPLLAGRRARQAADAKD